jgi:hypothetical protein
MNKSLRVVLILAFLASSLLVLPGAPAAKPASAAAEAPVADVPPPQPPDAGGVKLYFPMVRSSPHLYLVSGTVATQAGQPVAGALVAADDGSTAVTGPDGHYTLALADGAHTVAVSQNGATFLSPEQEVDVAGPVESLDFLACIQGIVDVSFEAGGWWLFGGTAAYNNTFHRTGVWSAQTGMLAGPDVMGWSFVRTPLIAVPAATTSANLSMWVIPMTNEPVADQVIAPAVTSRESALAPLDETAINATDAQYVMVLDAANAILEIVYYDRTAGLGWENWNFNMSKWAGQSIAIEIGTYSDGADGVTAMLIDDVSLGMCDDPIVPYTCQNLVLDPSAEVGVNWGLSGWDPWTTYGVAAYDYTHKHSGARSIRLGIPLESAANFNSYNWAWHNVTVPPTSTATMSVWIWPDTEEEWTISGPEADLPLPAAPEPGTPLAEVFDPEAPLGQDIQFIMVADPGTLTFIEYLMYERASEMDHFTLREYDLSAYAGQTVAIVFGVYNSTITSGRTVMYVDDFQVNACTGGIGPLPPLPPPPPPLPPPGLCTELIGNNSFEWTANWYIPATAYSASYATRFKHSGVRSMRTGMYYWWQNTYSYSDFGQQITIPAWASTVDLTYYALDLSGESSFAPLPDAPVGGKLQDATLAGDVQYLLVLDTWGNILRTLLWQRRNDGTFGSHWNILDDFIGQTIKLQWGTYNDGYNGVSSMWVDDVSVQACP